MTVPPLALAPGADPHVPMLLIIGFAVFFGTIGAKIFQRLRIPQVVGYIAIGLIAGRSVFGLIGEETVASLRPFNFFALGIIGFMIGGELHREVFRKYGRQFVAILLSEGLGAFAVVGLLTGGVALLLGVATHVAVALGVIFGAVSAATAPAATVNVLWEYKTRGVLTTAVFAIVALDDALALILYSIAASIASVLIGHAGATVGWMFGKAVYELIGGAALGAAAGLGLNFALRRARDQDKSLTFTIGAVAAVIGLARLLEVEMILASMVLGMMLANLAPRRSKRAFGIVERFAPPIYVLFFVIVGAHLDVRGMPGWMWALALPYILGRSAGKILGAHAGGRLAGAPPTVYRNLGWCLFSQGGVAVGLAILASGAFPGQIGQAIIMIVALTTFVVEVIGPPFVKFAVRRAGEVGLNVTEDDLMRTLKVSDMVDRSAPAFAQDTPLRTILRTISETAATAYPVTDDRGNLMGIITLAELKQSFSSEGLHDWLVAFDLVQPAPDTVSEDTPLEEAMTRMREQDLEYLPVISADGDQRLVGMLEHRAVSQSLSREILRRRQLADGTPVGA